MSSLQVQTFSTQAHRRPAPSLAAHIGLRKVYRPVLGMSISQKRTARQLSIVQAYSEQVEGATATATLPTESSAGTPINSGTASSGPFKRMREFKRSEEIIAYLRQQCTEDGNFVIGQAMSVLDSMLTRRRRMTSFWKVIYAYEALMSEVMSNLDSLDATQQTLAFQSVCGGDSAVMLLKRSQKIQPMFEQLLKSIYDRREELDDENFGRFIRGLGEMKYTDLEIIEKIAEEGKKRYFKEDHNEEFQGAYLLAMAMLSYQDPEFQLQVEQGIVNGTITFSTATQIRRTLNYLFTFGSTDPQVVAILCDRFVEVMEERDSRIWSQFLFNVVGLGASNESIQKVIDSTFGAMSDEDIREQKFRLSLGVLYRAQLLQHGTGSKFQVSPLVDSLAKENYRQQASKKSFVGSKTSTEMVEIFKKELPGVLIEQKLDIGAQDLQTDIAITKDSKRVAVECRFNSSYTINEPRKLVGSVKAIFQIMENLGWRVVVVDSEKIESDEYKQEIVQKVRSILETETVSKTDWQSS
eukprot:TRINITY_DN13879_c0_g1_i5.p1 TRINITY_DN13879_c0_g1~~TRINITY_DN13879_c0_g1_i5.p1  ORF type:complete len:536 (+),score=34.01 TRINITY_DN13879_c0_g1_i5:39-1610(+)